MALIRSTPEYAPLPPECATRARELLQKARFHTTSYGGGAGYVITDDEELKNELLEGWQFIGADGKVVTVKCGAAETFKYAPEGKPFVQLNMPVALIVISRELHDEERAQAIPN